MKISAILRLKMDETHSKCEKTQIEGKIYYRNIFFFSPFSKADYLFANQNDPGVHFSEKKLFV